MSYFLEIKVCGINDEISMRTATKYKADYVGLVFYERSPRNISINKSKKLLKFKGQSTKVVALTVNPTDELINQINKNLKPDYIQLHGNETPSRCKQIKRNFNIPVIKGLGISNKTDLKNLMNDFENSCDILLLDSPPENLPGGNGKKFDWSILSNFRSKTKWMLAGGINIENINEAIKSVNPPAIDISSGLEINKGIKDPNLIKNFILKCRNIETHNYDKN